MKPEFDRETDALLRDHARRGGAAPFTHDRFSPRRATAFAEHLDADELSAFAENAAPEAARARFLSHIADCDDCRRAATGLALAANAAPARDEPGAAREKIVTAASWRAWLAALVAPGAWRYAMPVVALLGVGVVALVLMKQVPLNDLGAARQVESLPESSNAVEPEQQAKVANDQTQSAQTATRTQTYDAPAVAAGEAARREAAPDSPRPARGKTSRSAAPKPTRTRPPRRARSPGASSAGRATPGSTPVTTPRRRRPSCAATPNSTARSSPTSRNSVGSPTRSAARSSSSGRGARTGSSRKSRER
ncbi:MAG: zf-HC2 domain-containing protein [Acidobacteria bacterium]|nr:zf-HC2 domain-containing protein [Acidobacteriota bacterium]